MYLYDTLYLYLFLPVFMGIYALLKPKRRPWLITAANILFIALRGWQGLVIFAVCFSSAYFSGIAIYNRRNDLQKIKIRKTLLTLNTLLNSAAALCIIYAGRSITDPTCSAVFFSAAVIPLHAISYITDVYRGSCPAQTRITVLASYLAFFPSAGFGPVIKYKNLNRTFDSPKLSHSKAASGIRYYVCGLSEFMLISAPLGKVWQDITSAKPEYLTGAPMWLGIVIFYVCFCTGAIGLLHMGTGTAMLMGFPIKRCYTRKFFKGSLTEHVKTFNKTLASWLYDYVYKPLTHDSIGGIIKCFAVILCCILGFTWYGCRFSVAAAGFISAVIIITENQTTDTLGKIPYALRCIISKIIILSLTAMICLPQLGTDNAASRLFSTGSGTQTNYLDYMTEISAPLLGIGALILTSIIPALIKKVGFTWFRAALPIIELVLIILCTSFMLAV